jgi:hypothetical protein
MGRHAEIAPKAETTCRYARAGGLANPYAGFPTDEGWETCFSLRSRKGDYEKVLAVPSEAKKYWRYSRECTKQAFQAETPELRDQLLDLARMWTEAALCEELNAKRYGPPSRLPLRSPNERELEL